VDGALSFTKDTDLSFNPADFGYTKPDDWIWCTEDQRYYGEFLTVSRNCSTDPCSALPAIDDVHGLRLTAYVASRMSQLLLIERDWQCIIDDCRHARGRERVVHEVDGRRDE
jgi:hypothetical protein